MLKLCADAVVTDVMFDVRDTVVIWAPSTFTADSNRSPRILIALKLFALLWSPECKQRERVKQLTRAPYPETSTLLECMKTGAKMLVSFVLAPVGSTTTLAFGLPVVAVPPASLMASCMPPDAD